MATLVLGLPVLMFGETKPTKTSGEAQKSEVTTGRQSSDPVLVGAGDIASCDDLAGAEATAKLIDKIPGTVFAAGDLAYPDGSEEQFAKCYDPTWGRFKDRIAPPPATMSTTAAGRRPTRATSGPRREIRRRHTTATIWAPGTSLSSTASARKWVAAMPHLRRDNG